MIVLLLLAAVSATDPCHVYTAVDADYVGDWMTQLTTALRATSAEHRRRVHAHVVVPGDDDAAETTLWRSLVVYACVAWMRALTGISIDVVYGGSSRYEFGRRRDALRDAYAMYTTRAPHLRVAANRQLAAAKLFVDEWAVTNGSVVFLDADLVFSGRHAERLLCATTPTLSVVTDPWYTPTDRELYSAARTTSPARRRMDREPWPNSGVMVINVAWWRQHVAPVVRRAVDAVADDRWEMFDQTVLAHAVAPSQRVELPLWYNLVRTARCPVAAAVDDDVCVVHRAGSDASEM